MAKAKEGGKKKTLLDPGPGPYFQGEHARAELVGERSPGGNSPGEKCQPNSSKNESIQRSGGKKEKRLNTFWEGRRGGMPRWTFPLTDILVGGLTFGQAK